MQNQLQAMVKGIRIEATGVRSIELSPLEGTFPAARAGSHIDLILPNGLIRQYSLLGGGSPHHYKVGVGLAEPSLGRFKMVHTQIKVGDALKISAPRITSRRIERTPLSTDSRRHRHYSVALHGTRTQPARSFLDPLLLCARRFSRRLPRRAHRLG